jgi:hypothetical protein
MNARQSDEGLPGDDLSWAKPSGLQTHSTDSSSSGNKARQREGIDANDFVPFLQKAPNLITNYVPEPFQLAGRPAA